MWPRSPGPAWDDDHSRLKPPSLAPPDERANISGVSPHETANTLSIYKRRDDHSGLMGMADRPALVLSAHSEVLTPISLSSMYHFCTSTISGSLPLGNCQPSTAYFCFV